MPALVFHQFGKGGLVCHLGIQNQSHAITFGVRLHFGNRKAHRLFRGQYNAGTPFIHRAETHVSEQTGCRKLRGWKCKIGRGQINNDALGRIKIVNLEFRFLGKIYDNTGARLIARNTGSTCHHPCVLAYGESSIRCREKRECRQNRCKGDSQRNAR
ncbi:hypothetical protein D3C80_1252440 [compost metagenome]